MRSSGAAPSCLSNSQSCGQPLATPRRSRRQAGERSAFPWSPARHVSRSLQQLEVCEHSGAPCTELCVLKRRKQEFLFLFFFCLSHFKQSDVVQLYSFHFSMHGQCFCFINKNGWKLIFRWSRRSQTLFVINNDVLQTMNNVNTNIRLKAEKLDCHREDSSMFKYTLRSHL